MVHRYVVNQVEEIGEWRKLPAGSGRVASTVTCVRQGCLLVEWSFLPRAEL